jgi:hypothetical protein
MKHKGREGARRKTFVNLRGLGGEKVFRSVEHAPSEPRPQLTPPSSPKYS